MQIHSLHQAHAAHATGPASHPKSTGPVNATSAISSATSDQLDLSAEAQALSRSQAAGQSSEASGIRIDRVAALRQAIAEGNYETPERLSSALDKLLDTFA